MGRAIRLAHAPAIAALALAASVVVAGPLGAATAPELRERSAKLHADLRRALTDAGRPFGELHAEFAALAAELEQAGLDSLACDARLGAGRALLRLSRNAEAEQQASLAVAAALRAKDPLREMRARLLGIDARITADPGLALRSVREAMPRARALGRDAVLAEALAIEGHALDAMGNFAEALVAYQQAADAAGRAGETHQTLMALTQCSQALRFLGRHPEALVLTDSVITVARREGLDAPLGRALFERASMLRTTHRFEPALAAIDEAIAIQRRRGDRNRLQSARLVRANVLVRMQRFRDCAAETETLLTLPGVRSNPVLQMRTLAVRGCALTGLGRAAEADTMLGNGLAAIERYRAGLPSDRDRAAVGEHLQEYYAAWTRARLALGRPRDAWVVNERGQAVALERRMAIAPAPDLGVLQARLRATAAALVAFDAADPVSGNVVVVTADTVAGVALPWPGMTISDLTAVSDRASSAQPIEPAVDAARRVSETLFAGVWPHLSRGIDRLVVIPPSRLEHLPFEILPEPGSTAALGERFAITYVPSASVFMALDRRDGPRRGINVLADPEIDPKREPVAGLDPALRGAVQRRLPGAREEAKRLARDGATVLLGRDATLARLRDTPPAAVLHFATHAYEDPRDPAGGGLLLAGEEPVLSPAGVETLGVAMDLVTLAGCGTLGTLTHPGEGTFGLARAFLVSGARTVVTTRWAVSDRAASRFMEAFYGGLRAGRPRDASLGEARAQLAAAGFAPRDCWAFALLGVGDRPLEQWTAREAGKSGPLSK